MKRSDPRGLAISPDPVSPLRVLIVEDAESDAAMVVRQLRKFHPDLEFRQVDGEPELRAALEETSWDVILCDFALPRFDAPRALAVVHELDLDVPFVVVSGEVGDEAAVALMKAGAQDYVRKENLERLGPAVDREIAEAKNRRDRRRADEALRASEERWQFAIEGAGDGVWDWSVPTNHVLFSARWKEMLGYADDEIGLDFGEWSDRLHPDDRERALTTIYRYLRSTDKLHTCEHRLRCKDGSYKHILSRGMVVSRDEAGAPLRVVGTHTDLTEHHAMQERLRQSEKLEAVGQLAGGVAHDFNNLLMILSLNVEQARREKLTAEVDYCLEQMAVAIGRAAKVTSQLLSFARRQPAQVRTINLDDELTGTLALLQRVLGEHITVKRTPAQTPLWVDADVGGLEQVLMNLCINARDAMPRGGTLTVATERVTFSKASDSGEFSATLLGSAPRASTLEGPIPEGRFACLRVSDTGQGIPPAVLSRVFEPFFTTKETGKGTGLGLASVYGIVKQLGGWVAVESTEGRGTDFRVYLPLSKATAATSRAEGAAGHSAGPVTETILLVEDEPMLRQVTATMLKRLGYRVLVASDGPAGLRAAREHEGPIDLLLTDMVMPLGLNGLQLAEELRRSRPTIKVVVSSGYSVDLQRQGDTPVAGALFLAKPFAFEALRTTLRRALDAPADPADPAHPARAR
jgi:PAS domain S-box-containing protein